MIRVFDMYMDYWVRMILFYKFLPGLMIEAQDNLCNPKSQRVVVSSEDNHDQE